MGGGGGGVLVSGRGPSAHGPYDGAGYGGGLGGGVTNNIPNAGSGVVLLEIFETNPSTTPYDTTIK